MRREWQLWLLARPARALFAIGSQKSKIANIAVPVVQRIEGRFPNPTDFPSCEGINSIESARKRHLMP
jgi:hypothetical protein